MRSFIRQPYLVLDYKKDLKFPTHKIIMLKAEVNYTHFFFQNRKMYTCAITLKHFEKILHDSGFVRVHKSYLVNTIHIQHIDLDLGIVTLLDGTELLTSRRRRKILKHI
jgi:two-component system LytT family response regulator